jgi:hypothetical protein
LARQSVLAGATDAVAACSDTAGDPELRHAGRVIFGGFTIIDFNRLRRAGVESAVPTAASIFLDILNVFLLMLQLFDGERD